MVILSKLWNSGSGPLKSLPNTAPLLLLSYAENQTRDGWIRSADVTSLQFSSLCHPLRSWLLITIQALWPCIVKAVSVQLVAFCPLKFQLYVPDLNVRYGSPWLQLAIGVGVYYIGSWPSIVGLAISLKVQPLTCRVFSESTSTPTSTVAAFSSQPSQLAVVACWHFIEASSSSSPCLSWASRSSTWARKESREREKKKPKRKWPKVSKESNLLNELLDLI